MSRQTRISKIAKLQKLRDSFVVVYVTSTRRGFEAQMQEDAVRVIYDHLLTKPATAKNIDLFIHSNGGSGTVPRYSQELWMTS